MNKTTTPTRTIVSANGHSIGHTIDPDDPSTFNSAFLSTFKDDTLSAHCSTVSSDDSTLYFLNLAGDWETNVSPRVEISHYYNSNRIHVLHFEIPLDARRTGLGTLLFGYILSLSRTLGANSLSAKFANKGGKPFLNSLGFAEHQLDTAYDPNFRHESVFIGEFDTSYDFDTSDGICNYIEPVPLKHTPSEFYSERTRS